MRFALLTSLVISVAIAIVGCNSLGGKASCLQKLEKYNKALDDNVQVRFSASDWSQCKGEYHSTWANISPFLQSLIFIIAMDHQDSSYRDIALTLVQQPWSKPPAEISQEEGWRRILPISAGRYLLQLGNDEDRKVIEERIRKSLDRYSSSMAREYLKRYGNEARTFLEHVHSQAQQGKIPVHPPGLERLEEVLEEN